MKKFYSFFLSLMLIFSLIFSNINVSFAYETPSVNAKYAVLMDYETGEILYDKNGNQKMYPASTTKLWTAYVVLKHVDDLNSKVKIENLEPVEGTSMYLKNGESFTVKELLLGLMLQSGNDCAVVLSRYVSGSVDKFVELMNKEAKEIGAKNTHFNNPHGLPDKEHTTTAYDMALMARKAMSNKVFREIVSTKEVRFDKSETSFIDRHFVNSNEFLTSNRQMEYKGKTVDVKYNIVDGIKTGYTDDAGLCLVSSAKKGDMRLISAVFKTQGNERYVDSRTLFDYGFDNFTSDTIMDKDDYIGNKNVFLSKQGSLEYQPKYSYKVVLEKNSNIDSYSFKDTLYDIELPIKKGDTVGKLDVYKDEKLEHTIDLVAMNDVNSMFGFITENIFLIGLFKILLMLIIIVPILLVILRQVIIYTKRRKTKNIFRKKRKTKRRF